MLHTHTHAQPFGHPIANLSISLSIVSVEGYLSIHTATLIRTSSQAAALCVTAPPCGAKLIGDNHCVEKICQYKYCARGWRRTKKKPSYNHNGHFKGSQNGIQQHWLWTWFLLMYQFITVDFVSKWKDEVWRERIVFSYSLLITYSWMLKYDRLLLIFWLA